MLYWRRVLAVVRGCQAPKCISTEPRGARKRVRWGVPGGAAQAGFTVGASYGLGFCRVKHEGYAIAPKKWYPFGVLQKLDRRADLNFAHTSVDSCKSDGRRE